MAKRRKYQFSFLTLFAKLGLSKVFFFFLNLAKRFFFQSPANICCWRRKKMSSHWFFCVFCGIIEGFVYGDFLLAIPLLKSQRKILISVKQKKNKKCRDVSTQVKSNELQWLRGFACWSITDFHFNERGCFIYNFNNMKPNCF